MSDNRRQFGKHYLVEFMGCVPSKLEFQAEIEPLFLEAARKSEATILGSHFYQFDPVGVTGMIFIAESHFSIHTWPEDGYVALDIFTCGTMFPERAIATLKEGLGAKDVEVRILIRGIKEQP